MRQRNAVDLPFSGPDFFDLHRGANFLTLVGGAVVIGRTFTDADGQPLTGKDAGPPEQPYLLRATTVAVLSYDYWQRRY